MEAATSRIVGAATSAAVQTFHDFIVGDLQREADSPSSGITKSLVDICVVCLTRLLEGKRTRVPESDEAQLDRIREKIVKSRGNPEVN
jgi:hypothetical protein